MILYSATSLSFLYAVGAPYALSYYFEPFHETYVLEFFTVTWSYMSSAPVPYRFWPWGLINNPIGALLRLWFVFEIYRSYRGIVTRRRVLQVGLLAEVWNAIVQAAHYLPLWYMGGPFWLYRIPVPLLLVVGLVLLYAVPPPRRHAL